MRNKYLVLLFVSNLLILLDQFSKYFVVSHIPRHHSFWVIDGIFSITHIRNPGVAFGLFASYNIESKAMIFIGISSIAIIAILIIFHQTESHRRLALASLILIFSGAIGNVIDRVIHGEVIDFLYFHAGDFQFPAFNVADSCISTGVAMMILDIVKHPPPQAGTSSDQNPV